MANDGSSGFRAEDRMHQDTRTNRGAGELWRYDGAAVMDLNGDGAPNRCSARYETVLPNNGSGYCRSLRLRNLSRCPARRCAA